MALRRPLPVPASSCLVPAAVPLTQEVGRILPVCTDMSLSDFGFFSSFSSHKPEILLNLPLVHTSFQLSRTSSPSASSFLPTPHTAAHHPFSHPHDLTAHHSPLPQAQVCEPCPQPPPTSPHPVSTPSRGQRAQPAAPGGGRKALIRHHGKAPSSQGTTSFVKNFTYTSPHPTCIEEIALGDWN